MLVRLRPVNSPSKCHECHVPLAKHQRRSARWPPDPLQLVYTSCHAARVATITPTGARLPYPPPA